MQIPYRTVEVSPLTKKQLKWADYKKVPVAVLDGEAYGDSTAIITRLAAELKAAEHSEDTAQHGRSSSLLWPFGSRKKSNNSNLVGSLAHWVVSSNFCVSISLALSFTAKPFMQLRIQDMMATDSTGQIVAVLA